MGNEYRDSMLILSTTRCSHRCRFCAYHMDTGHITEEIPSLEDMAGETESFFEERNDAITKGGELYIVNSGSFLDERQVPKEYISWLSRFLKGKDLRLIVECRADSKVENYREEILELVDSTSKLSFGIGLEVADDEILRNLRKGCRLEQYREMALDLQELGCGVKAYTLIAPPWMEGPSFLREGYRKSIDWAIAKAFETVKFAVDEMKVEIVGVSPFFPYKGTNSPIPEDWVPISATEAAEVANQLRQVLPNVRVDYTSRQIHFAYGNFFKFRKQKKPIENAEEVLAARENVARICEKVLGARGEISKKVHFIERLNKAE